MAMKLMDYVFSKSGSWTSESYDNLIELTKDDDAVVFQGPLSLNVAVVAEAVLTPVAGGNARNSVSDLYSYDVDVPAGYTWRYQMADSPAGQRVSGFKVQIRPAPCAPTTPVQAPDLPCDYAVCNLTNVGQFFPIGCEPCGSGPVRLPPTCGPSLAVMPAAGGCVRPRFFNGMNITREDLETQLRYLRLKNQLQRRADGDGVVWGLGLGRDGNSVCVQPGYAVDCCGNDLVVTSIYKVEAATLLSDPAVCNLITGKQQCMSLLLEYVECPEQARPIHGGDPCSNAAAGCEMSRVRETVRLRLVPTRDYQPRGPIQRFLAAISQGTQAANEPGQNLPPAVTATQSPTVPFEIEITCPDANGQLSTSGAVTAVVLQPPTEGPALTETFRLTGSTSLTITMPAPNQSGPNVMSGGKVVMTSSSPAGAITTTKISPPSWGVNQPISWQLEVPASAQQLEPPSDDYTATILYTVTDWTAPDGSGGTYSGTTAITVTAAGRLHGDAGTVGFQVSVAPTTVTLTAPTAAPFPCLTDPCCGSSPLFPVTPPWADANPFKPGQEGDLPVILLAVIYTLAAGMAAQNGQNASAYTALYQKVLELVDPNATTSNVVNQDTRALQQMLADLCCSLLYPGPTCEGEPHGVVIGCATISGREIERVEPWSGRRWVMHYPLWSYWGAQFGLVPADVLASRMFSFICCVAGLKPPGFGPVSYGSPYGIFSEQQLAVGSARLVVNPATPAAGTATETASLPVFAARVLSSLASQPAPAGTPMIDVALAGNPAIHLLVPNAAATSAAAPLAATSAPAAPQAATSQPSAAVTDQMQTAFAAAEVRAAVPPLLRSFATTLGTELINAMPLTTLNPPAAVLAPLTAGGIISVGALLAQTPDALYQNVLRNTEATDLSNLLTSAEAKPADIAHAVAAGLKTAASHHPLVSTDDLATADARAALADPLATSLHLPADTVSAAIAAALA